KYTNTSDTAQNYDLMIVKYSGANPGLLKYLLFGSGTVNEYATNSSTVFGHANAAGALAVGAANYYNTPPFGTDPAVPEPFSSAGGTPILFNTAGQRLVTPIVRKAPDIVAPDGDDTTFFSPHTDDNGNVFYYFTGTSAAAPHAAAVAAQMIQAEAQLGNPHPAPAVIDNALRVSALDMGEPGFDFDTGHGLLDAPGAVAALGASDPLTVDAGDKAHDGVPDTFTIAYDNGNMALTINGVKAIPIPASLISTLQINGSSDTDHVVIDESGGTIPFDVQFNGNGGTDQLNLQGGSIAKETYTATGPAAGSIALDGHTVTFADINAILDTVNAAEYTVRTTDADDSLNILDGGPVSLSDPTPTAFIISLGPTFVPVTFANKTTV